MIETTREQVIEAVRAVSKEHAELLNRFALTLLPDGVEQNYGLWIVPALVKPTNTPYKSLELNRALEDVQQKIEGLTGADVSVFLNHEN